MRALRLIGLAFAIALWAAGAVLVADGDAVAGGALLLIGALVGVGCLFQRERGSRIFETIAGFFASLP